MKLFTKEIDKKLFQQYSKGADLENQKVVARIFNPYGRGEWYLLNSDPEDPDYIWAIVSLFEVETGSVSRQELETIKVPPFNLNLERDLYFQPVNAKQLYDKLIAQQSERYDEGGQTKEFNLAGFLDYVYPTVNAAASMQGLVLRPDFSISDNGTKFYPYTPLLLSENGIVNEISLVYGEGEKSIGSIKFELDQNEFELEFEDWMVDTEGKYEMGGYLQQKMEDLPLAKTILGRAERSGYITPEEAVNPKFIWAAIETAEGHLEDEEIGSSDMTFIMKEFFDYFGDIGITTAWENSRLIVKRMDEGGIISDSEVEMLQEQGVTIEQMQTLLKSKFPDSFSFALYRPKEGTFGIKKPEPDLDADGYYGIQDASLKLYFDKFHSANYKIYQGEENTYYYFTLNDEKGNEYVGSFGFKDRGDVPKEYVTKFLVFLQQAYGQPFKVYHGVYEDGGYMAKGGNVKSKNYHKYGDENSRLVNFDIYDLDDFETMQYEHISKSVSKAEALQVLINNVEGDYSQLSPKLAKIAEEQHPNQEWEEEYRKGYMAGGGMSKKVTFDDKVTAISKRLKGTKVPARLRKDYGATYDSAEAKESAKRIAGSIRAKEMKNK